MLEEVRAADCGYAFLRPVFFTATTFTRLNLTRNFRLTFTRGFLILFVAAYPAFSKARHIYHEATVR